MFEKEAEEYLEKDGTKAEQILSLMQGKIKVKIKQIPFILAAFQQTYQDGAEFGYNKANEWHYGKDGDLPKDKTEKKYLVALKSEYSGFLYETDIWCESLHCFASNNPTKVYAWKEIVPPELKESE